MTEWSHAEHEVQKTHIALRLSFRVRWSLEMYFKICRWAIACATVKFWLLTLICYLPCRTVPVGPDQLLLRGAMLRNTHWIFGISYCYYVLLSFMPWMLWHCWLGVRRSIWPVKIEWWGVGVVICLKWGADWLHIVHLMPLHPQTQSSLASVKSDWFYLSGVSLPRLSWKRGC